MAKPEVMPKKRTEPDPRLLPFIDFVYETYRSKFSVTLVLDASDVSQLKQITTKTKNLAEFDLEHLQEAWLCFLKSRKSFDREQGHPLRFFCSNINRFMAQITKVGDDGNVTAARDFVRKRLLE